ncbi:MAG: hypothetical protein L0206_22430, partial [Actinobacteria bacterium]|nr:hypothetical protein [Actinomycetota bacterium]
MTSDQDDTRDDRPEEPGVTEEFEAEFGDEFGADVADELGQEDEEHEEEHGEVEQSPPEAISE